MFDPRKPPKFIKDVHDVIACVIDYGTFVSVAEKLAETMDTVYYYSPYEEEYQDVRECVQGTGLDKVIRLDNFLDPEVFDDIDLFVFPDIGYGGLQKHLKGLGKAVWGSMGVNDIEIYRGLFLDTLKDAGLPVIHSEKIQGLSDLREYLKENDNKWVKIDRYRMNMETWHHLDYVHSERMLDSLAVIFGGAKEMVSFVVQDNIESDIEAAYDAWCVDGQFPSKSFQGYEKKNELYLGSLWENEKLPEEVRFVNEKMAPLLEEHNYRTWWATEIRIKDGVPYFIDPTPRMPGQTGEQQLETCENFADVIWSGANGILIEPKFKWNFAASATLHYDGLSNDKDNIIEKEWKILNVPEDINQWVKLYHYCKIDGIYHFPPSTNSYKEELGVVLGVGDSIQDSIDNLQEHLDDMKDLPLHANVAGFANLLNSIEEAEKQGMKFAPEVPDPKSVIDMIK